MGKDFQQRGGRGGSRGGRGGFGGGRGGQRQNWDQGPPAEVIEVGHVMHPCQEYVVVKHTLQDRVPIFNRPVYLENKTKIGVIDDVFGPINEYLYMNPEHFLPFQRFLPRPPGAKPAGGFGGAGRGGRGGSRGGRGGNFGGRGGSFGGRGGNFGGRGGSFGGRGGSFGGRGGFRGGR